jgi:hypothetical protein
MSTLELLRQALVERPPVSASYDGFPRLFCPHVLGTTDGEERCLAWQFGGEGSRGPVTLPSAAWRCLRVAKLTDVRLQPGAWQAGPLPLSTQTCVRVVALSVEG